MKTKTIFLWVLRALAALIMLQTLYFKFSAAPESVYIFSTLGLEPWGRIGIGIAELFAAVLILVPATVSIGALLAIGIMSGALFAHLTKLGVEVQGDGGYLFILCITVFISALILLFAYRRQVFNYLQLITGKKPHVAAG
jgi:uncharacterized membrane protein YphA (DoxX/SURF4 family)